MSNTEKARKYRAIHGYVGKGGVIVIYGDEVQGWVNELRNPEHWAPGCVAVAEDGTCHKAVGGSEYVGAERWVLCVVATGLERLAKRARLLGAAASEYGVERALFFTAAQAADRGEHHMAHRLVKQALACRAGRRLATGALRTASQALGLPAAMYADNGRENRTRRYIPESFIQAARDRRCDALLRRAQQLLLGGSLLPPLQADSPPTTGGSAADSQAEHPRHPEPQQER